MKKLAFTIFLITVTQIGYSQLNKEYLMNTWMSIDCIEDDTIYNDHCESKMIFKFTKDSLFRYYAYDGPIPYQITDTNNLEYGDIKGVKIITLTKDTLKLGFYNSTLVFIPVPRFSKSFNHDILNDLLVNNEWTLNTYYNTVNRYEFLDYIEDSLNYAYYKSKDIYSVEKINPGNSFPREEIFWTLRTLNGTTILFINKPVDFIGDSYDILINDVRENRISGSVWQYGKKYSIDLDKQDNISSEMLAHREKLLTNALWELDEFDIIVPDLRAANYHFASIEIDSSLILDSIDIVHKVLKYDFNSDKTFRFFINNRVAARGNWKFSKSGTILKLKQQSLFDTDLPFTEKYIELDKLTEQELHFINSEEIFSGNYSENDYSFDIYPVIQKYKNRR